MADGREVEVGGQHADDASRRAVEDQRAGEHAGIAAEGVAPELGAQDDGVLRSADSVLGVEEVPPALHADFEDGEEVGGHPSPREPPRAIGRVPREAGESVARDSGERLRLGTQVDEIRVGDLAWRLFGRRGFPEMHQAIRASVGQSLEQHGVDDAEQGRGGPDAERQGEHGERRPAAGAEQRTDRQAEFTREVSHRFSLFLSNLNSRAWRRFRVLPRRPVSRDEPRQGALLSSRR